MAWSLCRTFLLNGLCDTSTVSRLNSREWAWCFEDYHRKGIFLEVLPNSRYVHRGRYESSAKFSEVLVAVLAMWNPVDYFTRLIQPWSNLSKGASAMRTLLLDLISPLQPVILYSAARHREWPVVLATSIAVALTTIASLVHRKVYHGRR
jgi:hypothetical protein